MPVATRWAAAESRSTLAAPLPGARGSCQRSIATASADVGHSGTGMNACYIIQLRLELAAAPAVGRVEPAKPGARVFHITPRTAKPNTLTRAGVNVWILSPLSNRLRKGAK